MNLERKPLETSRRLLTFVGVFSTEKNTKTVQKLVYFSFGLFIFLSVSSVTVASAIFYGKFLTVDLESNIG